jgi:hypothetical protein
MIGSACLNLQLPSFSIETAAYLQYAGGVVARARFFNFFGSGFRILKKRNLPDGLPDRIYF